MLIDQTLEHDKVHLVLLDLFDIRILDQHLGCTFTLSIGLESQIELKISLHPDDKMRSLLHKVFVWIAACVSVIRTIIRSKRISAANVYIAIKIAIEMC